MGNAFGRLARVETLAKKAQSRGGKYFGHGAIPVDMGWVVGWLMERVNGKAGNKIFMMEILFSSEQSMQMKNSQPQ